MAKSPVLKRVNFELLSLAILNNLDYFYFTKDKFWYSEKFVVLLQSMYNHIQWYEYRIKQLSDNAHRFDLNENTHGNGFRSFDIIFDRYFTECYTYCKDLNAARGCLFFMPRRYLKQLEAHLSIIEGLKIGLKYLLKMLDSKEDHLLTVNRLLTAEEIIKEYGLLNQAGFYGRYQAFYFCPSMRKTLWGVSVIMASFSDLYQKTGSPLSRALSAITNGLKYIYDPELRSQQIINVAQNSSVEFLKAFWSLSETHFMKQLPKWICPKLMVVEEIFVPAEPIYLQKINSEEIAVIPVPSSHLPPAPVRCLLLSASCRQGQLVKGYLRPEAAEPSPALLLHCHGGGFISNTPEAHEIYLRNWAYELQVPILSVDYSLAPAARFPRALEEVLLAYSWALKNPSKLGWTGKYICFAGDSAGGNVLMGIVLRSISLGIRRPDAILCAYSPLILDMVPSPSRLMCWIDPLLPLGFMLSCLDAYAGQMLTDDNEYVTQPKKRRKSTRERKLSSISEILDSGISFLKEPEWKEVEPNEPETNKTSISPEMREKINYVQKALNQANVPLHSEPKNYNDYVSSFTDEYSNNLEKTFLEECKLDDFQDHVLFNLPNDLMHAVRQKYNSVLVGAFEKLSDVIEQSTVCKIFLSPLIKAASKASFKAKVPALQRSESTVTEKLKKLKLVSKNPYMSPLMVSDVILKEMPPVYFISLNFDPCLDDSITFAKRLTSVGKPVVVDILDGLPHGFLNFLPFSQEAHNGSNLCVKRLKEALHLNDAKQVSSLVI